MTLPCGRYRTANGSRMCVSGTHAGIREVVFDWLEEGACIDCIAEAYEVDGRLIWNCDYCGGGSAELYPDTGGPPMTAPSPIHARG